MPSAKKSSGSKPYPGCGMVKGGKYSPPNLMKTNPTKEQFAPTDAQPIRQRARMGGDPMGDASFNNRAAMEAAGEAPPKARSRQVKDQSDKDLQQLYKDGVSKGEVKSEIVKRINDPVR